MNRPGVSPFPEPPWQVLSAQETQLQIGFSGWVTSRNQPCWICHTPDTATTLRGPAPYGLVEDDLIDLIVVWCSVHGRLDTRLVNADGSDYEPDSET